jgi:hypothetical protein
MALIPRKPAPEEEEDLIRLLELDRFTGTGTQNEADTRAHVGGAAIAVFEAEGSGQPSTWERMVVVVWANGNATVFVYQDWDGLPMLSFVDPDRPLSILVGLEEPIRQGL